MGAMSFWHWALVILVVVLLFGRGTRHVRPAPAVGNGMRSVVDRMKSWFQGNF